jgi:hypothetical protein
MKARYDVRLIALYEYTMGAIGKREVKSYE